MIQHKSIKGAIPLGLLLLISLPACRPGPADSSTPVPSPFATTMKPSLSAVNPEFMVANTRFGFKLFSHIRQRTGNQNIFISPTSLAIALSMTYDGADGQTQEAMADALEFRNLSLEEVNRGNAALQAYVEGLDPAVKLTIANSLWANQQVAFKPDFLQQNQDFYQAEVRTLDFSHPQAPAQINTWVQQNTQGKIQQIVDQIDPLDILFLINAIYFKGSWQEAFDPGQTQERPFNLLNGSQKQHPMMARSDQFLYLETEQFQAVSLPYGQGRLSMDVFLPRQDITLEAFAQTLTADNWQTWMAQFRPHRGSLQLPRFRVEYDVSLQEALEALGMAVAFDPDRADFSRMTDWDAFISEVRHKTFVDVNEEGTEAAAVTSVRIQTTAAVIDPEFPFQMTVDRPFFFAIRDQQTGAILFMGTITNPS